VLPVFTAEEMRAVDRRAITNLGIPGATLMENAGRGAAKVIAELFPTLVSGARRSRPVVVVCGKGGNGGDGFVVARTLRRRGLAVRVLLAFPTTEIRGDAARKLAALRQAGVRPHLVEDDRALEITLAEASIVVDALLGTGTRGTPSEPVAAAITAINRAGRPVVALDVPSGLDADGGAAGRVAVRAAVTVTFGGLKRGLVAFPGAELAGDVRVVPIGVPAAEIGRGVTMFLLEAADIAAAFPARPRDVHKGTYGHLLVVAGSVGKTGAAALAAMAAMRSGTGLVTVATPESQQPIVAGLVREPMTLPVAETRVRTIAIAAHAALVEAALARDAVALGPGLGLEAETQDVVRRLAREVRRPMVIDADGLTALAGHLKLLREAPAPRCLTPHPGEMARMLGVKVADVQKDRIEAVRAFVRAHRAHCVLKGPFSVIGVPDGRIFLNPTGNPGMASGGTGDVLTGVVGGFLARGMEPTVALTAAVYLHGLAGDLGAARVGQEALVAGDLIEALPAAFATLARR
jgi:ADP-dependent NAD(P)H-hydrate dehydratase / NAD(P)H-hydrate epimerase